MITTTMQGRIIAVCRSANPGLPKPPVDEVHLLAGLGVEGDYHAGKLVRHRSIAKRHPDLPNRRQVLIVDTSTYTELTTNNIHIEPGMLGENITVEGLHVMQIPSGTRLALGTALVEVTEIRRPCYQLCEIDERLLSAVIERNGTEKRYKAGIMTCVLESGWACPGDAIIVLETVHNKSTM